MGLDRSHVGGQHPAAQGDLHRRVDQPGRRSCLGRDEGEMIRNLLAATLLVAAVTSGQAAEEATGALAAPPSLVEALKERFPTLADDNVWIDIGGGFNCGGCSLV